MIAREGAVVFGNRPQIASTCVLISMRKFVLYCILQGVLDLVGAAHSQTENYRKANRVR